MNQITMNDTLELNVEGQDLELNKDKLPNMNDLNTPTNPSIGIMPKSIPKRIVYDLSDNEKAKHNFKAKTPGKINGKKIASNKKDVNIRANGLNRHNSVESKLNGNRESFKISTSADLRDSLKISTSADLRDSLKSRQCIDRKGRIESQVKIEYVREPPDNTKPDDLQGSGYVKEELKRDILNLKSKLEGVEAKVNNNYFPNETITKIECHSNYKLHMKASDARVKSQNDVKSRDKIPRDKVKSNLGKFINSMDSRKKAESERRMRRREKSPLHTSEKIRRLSRNTHSDKRTKLSDYERRHRERHDIKESGRRRNSEITRRNPQKTRSRFPSGDLDKLRSKRAEKTKLKICSISSRRNKSLSPNSKVFRNKVFDQALIKHSNNRHMRRGSDPGHSPEQNLSWPQFKQPTDNSISYDSEVTLSQNAFGLHPDVHPKPPIFDKNSNLRNDARSITPIYDSKRLDSTPVLFQSPLLKQSDNWFSTRLEGTRKGKGIDWKTANNLKGNEILRYIESCSTDYINQLDRSFPDLRRVVGHLVSTVVPKTGMSKDKCNTKASEVLPCDIYNQNDACPYSLLHLDSEQNQRIHSCTLCYFSLQGLINLHRQTRCPLLNIIKN